MSGNYETLPLQVEACQLLYGDSNLENVRDWILTRGGKIELAELGVIVLDTWQGRGVLMPGCWVTLDQDGRFMIWGARDFNQVFKETGEARQ